MTTSLPPLGATVDPTGVTFRVWAPDHAQVDVAFDADAVPPCRLSAEGQGVFVGRSPGATAGTLYKFRLSGGELQPDPYSRFQPQGPQGPSMVVDPSAYAWSDAGWSGLDATRQVLYELHVGTFTPAGTYDAAAQQLEALRDLGVTCIEMMPVNEFAGRFGWGYDGVNWFAPYHEYGSCDALRDFVNRAHELGLGVILDVVYNHFGREGNSLPHFAAQYLTTEVCNPWGCAPNYACQAMRRLAIDNAAAWIREFHFDGLRLDAVQAIHDPQAPELLAAMISEARAAGGTRQLLICAEDYLQRTPLLGTRSEGGAGIDQLWNDDFHHCCRVVLTGNHYGFFRNYQGTAQELVSSLQRGFLFQGQYDAWFKGERGAPVTDELLTSFVAFTQNHDAVGNTLDGRRLQRLVSPGKYRAITALLLLGPQTPLIFMGQEFNASTLFPYFADYPGEWSKLWKGRREEAGIFDPFRDPAAAAQILDPCSLDTFQAARLNHAERQSNHETLQLFTDLLALRRQYAQALSTRDLASAVLTPQAFAMRWSAPEGTECLFILNLGAQMECRAWPEPLLVAPPGRHWSGAWASDSPRYGGMGVVDPQQPGGWQFAAETAHLLVAAETLDSVDVMQAGATGKRRPL